MLSRQFGRDRARRDDRGADIVGLHFLPQPLGDHAHGMLGGRIDGAARAHLVAGDRRDVDDVAALLRLHVRQRGGDAVEHALDVDVDHPIPVVDLQRSSGECGIRPALLRITSMRPCDCDGAVDQTLDLVAVGDVGLHGGIRAEGQFLGQAFSRSRRRAPSTSLAPCARDSAPSPRRARCSRR